MIAIGEAGGLASHVIFNKIDLVEDRTEVDELADSYRDVGYPVLMASATSGEGMEVTFTDHVLNRKLQVSADMLVLSAGMQAADTEELSGILKLARTPEDYFMEAHVKLRPVDMATEGIFVCGTAHSPKLLSETISQAYAESARAITFLSQAN